MPLTKTAFASNLAFQQLTALALVNSTEVDISEDAEIFVGALIGRDDTGGALTVGALVRFQGNPKPTGDDHWQDLATFQSAITAPVDEAVSGTCASGQPVVGMANTTGFTAGALILIKNSTPANSEVHRIKSVASNTSVTLEDNLTNAQTGSTCYTQAEKFSAILPVAAISRFRIQADNVGNASRTFMIEAYGAGGAI